MSRKHESYIHLICFSRVLMAYACMWMHKKSYIAFLNSTDSLSLSLSLFLMFRCLCGWYLQPVWLHHDDRGGSWLGSGHQSRINSRQYPSIMCTFLQLSVTNFDIIHVHVCHVIIFFFIEATLNGHLIIIIR